jgi:hypothetical protein
MSEQQRFDLVEERDGIIAPEYRRGFIQSYCESAVDVAALHADGNATDEQLASASAAAWAAEWDDAPWTAPWTDPLTAAGDAKKEMFIKMCNGVAPWQKTKE